MLKNPTLKARESPAPMRRRGMVRRAISARPRGSVRGERRRA
jgi:hypothetical protein